MDGIRKALGIGSGLALAAILAVGPYLGTLDQYPWAGDSLVWMERGSIHDPDWLDWVLRTSHFIAWRPVTALSFVVDSALAQGVDPRRYRITALVLAALAGALTWLVARAWTERGWVGWLPVLVVLGHPVVDDIVMIHARRSYLLALDFALAALLVHRVALVHPAASLGTAALLGLGVASHEQVLVVLPVLGVLAWPLLPRRRAALIVAPSVVVCALILAARAQVLGDWLGGYEGRPFAALEDGTQVLEELDTFEPLTITTAVVSYLLDPHGLGGEPPLLPTIGLVVLTGWMAWIAVVAPWRERRWRALAWTTWLVGGIVVVVVSHTWFWRQAHALLAPLGLLWADELLAILPGLRAGTRSSWLRACGLGVGLVTILQGGPLVRGTAAEKSASREAAEAAMTRVRALIRDLQGPGQVWLVVPIEARHLKLVAQWCTRDGARRDLECNVVGTLADGARPEEASLRFSEADGGRLWIERGMDWNLPPRIDPPPPAEGLRISELWIPAREHHTWLVAYDADEAWSVRIRRPPGWKPPGEK